MYILQNALQNLMRNKGRNIMIGIIVFVVIVSSVISLMINNTADGVINDYKDRFASEVSITPNMTKMMEEAQKNRESSDGRGPMNIMVPEISPDKLISFGDSEYLKSAVYTAESKGNSAELKAIDEDLGPGGGMMGFRVGTFDGSDGESDESEPEPEFRQYYHKITANQYSDFTDGLRELTEGSRLPENKGECIISQELLENSGLSVGDVITVTSALEMTGDDITGITYADIEFELTIVGTYVDATDEYQSGMMQNAYTNRRNEILTTVETLAEKIQEGYRGINVTAKYYLKNPDMLAAFAEEVYAKGLSDIYDVTTDESSYDTVVKPVVGLKGISVAFCIIVLAFGAVIIALLSSIAIRERKYEIGVLRAMGMKKGTVVLGLWTEMLVLTTLCLVIGLGVGTAVAQPVSDIMIEQQLAAIENTNDQNGFFPAGGSFATAGGGGIARSVMGSPLTAMFGRANAQPLDSLDVSLNLMTILEIIGISILLSSLAALIATRKITMYEPIKILMERN